MLRLIPIFLIIVQCLPAEVRLPAIFADQMVLQRNKAIKIWGWCDPNEAISLSFNRQEHSTTGSDDGNWSLTLEPMQASSKPLDMIIRGENTIVIEQILIGDVWLCAGQSNMEWVVGNSLHGEEAIRNANDPEIRLLYIPPSIEFRPQKDIKSAVWRPAIGENIKHFSAVGYFFGKHIHESQGVPVGLISATRGGSSAETWMSAESLRPLASSREALQFMETAEMDFQELNAGWAAAMDAWLAAHYPASDAGMEQKWYAGDYDFQDWDAIEVPSPIERREGLEDFDGVIWYKKTFVLPEHLKHQTLFFRPGSISDMDETWLNGKKIGETFRFTPWRSYKISPEILRPDGENVITMRIFNAGGKGGMTEPYSRRIFLSPARWSLTPDDLELAGSWKFRTSLRLKNPVATLVPEKTNPNDFPSCLYNGTLHPIIPFAIKGAIWYQGESNAKSYEDAIRYREVFTNLITGWRTSWGDDFAFYFVQLPNYLPDPPESTVPVEGIWPYMRESQMAALDLPATGMAVTIDAGNPHDIHPREKQVVGYRLGRIAEAKTYGDASVVYSGPVYASHEVEGNRVVIQFSHTGSGLRAKGSEGELRGFQLAGEDRTFFPAEASLTEDQVTLLSAKVDSPVAIRYAWEDNPDDANLYNKEGLPAAPFRTDNWDHSASKVSGQNQ